MRGFGQMSTYKYSLQTLREEKEMNPSFQGPFTEREVFDQLTIKPFLDFRAFGATCLLSSYKFIEMYGPNEFCRLFNVNNLEAAHNSVLMNKWEIRFHSICLSAVSSKLLILYLENEEQIRYFVRPITTMGALSFYSFILKLSIGSKAARYTEEFNYKNKKMHTYTFSKEKGSKDNG